MRAHGRRYLLTHLHPMLGGVVGMRGSTVVEARLIPHDGLLPTSQVRGRAVLASIGADWAGPAPLSLSLHCPGWRLAQATVRVEPLAVEIAESPVLKRTVGVLGEVARCERAPLHSYALHRT